MTICGNNSCTGCGLCMQICPQSAIEMKEDNVFGHFKTVVDKKKCIGCSKCKKMCPSNAILEGEEIRRTYAAWNKNKNIHSNSSSGGMASAIYTASLKNNCWIVGTFMNEDLTTVFKLSNDAEDIVKFRGSKYTQPFVNEIYIQVLDLLKASEKVTFIGLPCHCAAMKKVAALHLDNLILVDLICHGVPSQKTLMEHVGRIEKEKSENTTAIRFRDSKAGVIIALEKDQKTFYIRYLHEDEYMHSFITGNIFSDCCYNCRYAKCKRISDLTIGDFWGLGKYGLVENKLGKPSVVLVNSEKGEKFCEQIKDYVIFEERPTIEAIEGNAQLSASSKMGGDRSELIFLKEEMGIEQALKYKYGFLVKRNYRKRKNKDLLKKVATLIGVKYIYKNLKNPGVKNGE